MWCDDAVGVVLRRKQNDLLHAATSTCIVSHTHCTPHCFHHAPTRQSSNAAASLNLRDQSTSALDSTWARWLQMWWGRATLAFASSETPSIPPAAWSPTPPRAASTALVSSCPRCFFWFFFGIGWYTLLWSYFLFCFWFVSGLFVFCWTCVCCHAGVGGK